MAERRVVVHRPEPPSDEDAAKKLSRDEMRALLAVTAPTKKRSAWSLTARRGGLALVPTLVVSTILDAVIGWWSIPVVVALGIAWAAWPLVRQRRDGWT